MCAVSPVRAGREAAGGVGGLVPACPEARPRLTAPEAAGRGGGRRPLGCGESLQRQPVAPGCEGDVTGAGVGDPAATLPSPGPLAGSGDRGGTEPRTRSRAARAAD